MVYKHATTTDIIVIQRQRVARIRATANLILPFLQQLTEKGRTIARSSISELDVTARFTDIEDKIIALFASLACKAGQNDFTNSSLWDYASPREMVYKRLFTDIERCTECNIKRFRRLMDIMWLWTHDYGSAYDAFETLVHDPDPVSTFTWMLGVEPPVYVPEYRIPRFLMALMLSDDGIGQGLVLHQEPEALTLPVCSAVYQAKQTFCPIQDIEFGEVAHILGLSYETDLYYLALGWEEMRKQNPSVCKSIKRSFSTTAKDGAAELSNRKYLRRLCGMLM